MNAYTVELATGQVWLPHETHLAPRQIVYGFLDVTDTAHIRWCFPGFRERGGVMTEKAFRGWIHYRGATPQ